MEAVSERARMMPKIACFEPVYRGANGKGVQEAMEPIRMRDLKVEGDSGFK